MSQDNTPTLTYDNIVGMVQRDLAILQSHLNQPLPNINAPACVAHLERMMHFMGKIPAPEQMQPPAQNGAAQREARAN